MTAIPEASPSKLSRATKLAYGVGDLGPAIVASVNGFFLNAFLLDVAGLRPGAVGIIFLIVKIWDSVNDPLIGSISDRTNTRWGDDGRGFFLARFRLGWPSCCTGWCRRWERQASFGIT